ncbi:MAG: hypothetical protein AAF514_13355, partial [Verrucomicrobiota bacterium]
FRAPVPDGHRLEGSGIRVELAAVKAANAWDVLLSKGTVRLPGDGERAFRIRELHCRAAAEEIFLNHGELKMGEGTLDLEGEMNLENHQWHLDMYVSDLPVKDWIKEDWKKRLLGNVHGEVEWRGERDGDMVQTGRLEIRDGILQALPVLDSIAEHTRTERFRRLVLSRAEGQFEKSGRKLVCRNVLLESAGLLRLKGSLIVDHERHPDGELEGNFQMGVAANALKWIPGARKRVFTEERSGFHWTTLGVKGTVSQPEEDLSARLKSAATMALVEETPRVILEKSTEMAAESGRLLEETVEGVKNVIDRGKRFIPFFGGNER